MPSNNSLITQYWAKKRSKPNLTSSSTLKYAETRVLALLEAITTAHAVGSTSGIAGPSVNSSNPFTSLYDLEDGRFLILYLESGGALNAAVITTAAAGDPTLGTGVPLGNSTSVDMHRVIRNPVNPLQMVVLGHQQKSTTGFAHLVTVGASGTTVTVTDINIVGGTAALCVSSCAVLWGTNGNHFAIVGKNDADARLAGAVFTVSGTSATYVTRAQAGSTIAASAGVDNQGCISHAWFTGVGAGQGAAVINAGSTNNAYGVTFTFTSSSISITQQAALSVGGTDYKKASIEGYGRTAIVSLPTAATTGKCQLFRLDASAGIVTYGDTNQESNGINSAAMGVMSGAGHPVLYDNTYLLGFPYFGQTLDIDRGRHIGLIEAASMGFCPAQSQYMRLVSGSVNIIPTAGGYNNVATYQPFFFAVNKDFTRAIAAVRSGSTTRIFGYNIAALGI